jgi:serine/threonine protein kinase
VRIIHRDLKPANILLRSSGGPPVVADFGLCYIEDGERHTLTEEAIGPRLFIAPELEDGRTSDSDITPVLRKNFILMALDVSSLNQDNR